MTPEQAALAEKWRAHNLAKKVAMIEPEAQTVIEDSQYIWHLIRASREIVCRFVDPETSEPSGVSKTTTFATTELLEAAWGAIQKWNITPNNLGFWTDVFLREQAA